jgi:hypothetical protein
MNRWQRFKVFCGEYLDGGTAVASAVVAAVLTLTSLLGLTSSTLVQALIPWTLGALSVTVLRDRFADRASSASVDELKSVVRRTSQSLVDAVRENSASVHSLTRNEMFDGQEEPYGQLIEYIKGADVKRAVFVQCSGFRCLEVLTAAMRKGATVDLYLVHEETARDLGSKKQERRIVESKSQNLSELVIDYPQATLNVFKIAAPASARLVRIDDKVICAGWYTYEKIDRSGRDYSDDRITISGHDRPTMITWAGTKEFSILDRMLEGLLEAHRGVATTVPLTRTAPLSPSS